MQHAIAWAIVYLAAAATLAGLAWDAGLADLVRAWRRGRNITINVRTVPGRRQP